jgi:uridine phosphorylase
MARTKSKTCSVTGVKTSSNNFYSNQNHVKAVDNIRRNTSATKEQLTRMFNQINNY